MHESNKNTLSLSVNDINVLLATMAKSLAKNIQQLNSRDNSRFLAIKVNSNTYYEEKMDDLTVWH